MTGIRRANRLYIPAGPIRSVDTSTSWIEIRLTDEFLNRIVELFSLLTKHQLESVTVSIEANWHLESIWTVKRWGREPGCMVEVFEWGFVAKCSAEADHYSARKDRYEEFQAAYVWGDASDLVEYMGPTTDFPQAFFEKAGGWETDIEEEAFRNMVVNEP